MPTHAHGLEAQPAPTRILLVEDDDELREGLAENLRLSGMSVTEANCGGAFHAARRKARFDVAIIDVNLPDENGFDLAANMLDDNPAPGVILLTARTGQADRIRGYAEGADLYLTKPVAGEELLLAVRNLAKRVRSQEPPPVDSAVGGWLLDMLMRRLVASDGRFLELSGREIWLIEQFVDTNGDVLSRQSLSEGLGYGVPGPKNRALDAVLRRLRLKFDELGLGQPIVSVNNLGIRFVDPLRKG